MIYGESDSGLDYKENDSFYLNVELYINTILKNNI